MKKLITLIAVLIGLQVVAQNIPPQAINFQGVAIDKNGIPVPGMDELGNPIQNSAIRVRFSILTGTATGTISYQEEHLTTTDEFGRFNLEIGRGTATNGVFSAINWGGDKHFLQVEVDLSALGTNYTLASVQEFISVPYALYSRASGLSENDLDTDPNNEIQTLTLSGNLLEISGGNSISLPTNTDNQTLSISGTTLTISGGNSIAIPDAQTLTLSGNSLSISNGNAVNLPTDSDNQTLTLSGSNLTISGGNNITLPLSTDSQTLSISGNQLSISNGNNINLPSSNDNDSTNEIQTISQTGNNVFLSKGGGSFTIFDGDYNSLSNRPFIPSKTSDLINDAGFINTEVDGSISNELQALSISNDTIFLSNGGYVKLPNTPTPNKSINSNNINDLFGLSYTGSGILGDYYSNISTLPSYKFLNYDDFFLFPGDTLNLKAQIDVITPTTTVLFVQDTCFLAGFVNGKGFGPSYRGLNFNTPLASTRSTKGLQSASGSNNTSTGSSGSPKYFFEGSHTIRWNEWGVLKYAEPYQEQISNLYNDTAFTLCAAQYGEISGQDGGSGGQAYQAEGGRGGRGLIIIAKTLIINNAIFDLRGISGTASPNTAYVGGAGGGGSLFISYENGTIFNPIINTSGGLALPVSTSIPLTNGANGRHLFHQR